MPPVTPTLPELAAQIERIYREQTVWYRRLLQLTQDFPATLSSSQSDEVFAAINEAMNIVSRLDADVSRLREQWNRLGGKATGTLAETLKGVEQLVVELMQRIDGAEQSARETKAKLAPRMSVESRRRKMTVAYQAVQETSSGSVNK
jgi:uncharacterized protein YukE